MRVDKKLIQRHAKIELAKRNFFEYCRLKAPDFYKADRTYLVELCNDLQAFYESDDEILIINLPPRMGKSRTMSLFVEWILGKDKTQKIITGSYNETLSTVFSKNVRNSIQEEKADQDVIVYSDIFPDSRIKRGDGSMNLWSLEGAYSNYLATSPQATVTGFGGNWILIDDLIRNAEESFNDRVLEEHWLWFTQTMLSRLEEGGKIILVMTRWSSKDLAGRCIEAFKDRKMKLIVKKAMNDDGTMLCEEVLSKDTFLKKSKLIGEHITSANYQQIPIDLQGALYRQLLTYEELPRDENDNILFECIRAYCDTADEGSDFLCNIIYGVYDKQAYILDVYYTKDHMEITEKEVAKRLHEFNVNIADIESNNGGKGFARSVQRILKEVHNTRKVSVRWFHQSKNKKARILTASSWVQENVFFPAKWSEKWSEFYRDVISYQKEGKNKHDDCVEALSEIFYKIEEADAIFF